MPARLFWLYQSSLAPIYPAKLMAIALMAGLLLAPFSAVAQPQTPEPVPTRLGNLPPGFYPAPPCAKPVLEKDTQATTKDLSNAQLAQMDLNAFGRKVEKFNEAVAAYNQCAKTYIQRSQYDIERIVSTVNAALAEGREIAPPAGAGNLQPEFYPRSPCVRPDQTLLDMQPAVSDGKGMEAYNLKVEKFNQQAAVFNFCVKDYRDKAQHDIQEIQAAVQPATARDALAPRDGSERRR